MKRRSLELSTQCVKTLLPISQKLVLHSVNESLKDGKVIMKLMIGVSLLPWLPDD